MDTKDCIFPFVNCESGAPADLKQVYLKEDDIFEDTRVCPLCMQIMTYGFTVIEEDDVDLLCRYIPDIIFHGESKEVICNGCRGKLNAALEFRSKCLNDDKMIIPHADCEKMLQYDLGEFYMKENGNGYLTGISYNPKICRLCTKLITDEILCIGEEELEAIHKFIPEIIVRDIKDPVVCKSCFDSVSTHNTFLKACSEREQKIADIFESSATESQTDATLSGLIIKTENLDSGSEINEEYMSIKTETVDIKSEEDGEGSDTLLLHSSDQIFENNNCKDEEEEEPERIWKHENRSVDNCGMEIRENRVTFDQYKSDRSPYQCDKCIYETNSKIRFTSHYATHGVVLKGYKCDICDYVAKKKPYLKRHSLRHKDPSELQMFKCNDCDYKAKEKNSLACHVLGHKDPSQVRMYKCDACDFESRYKSSFKNHQLVHKDPSEVQMYRCIDCEYKTKFKNNFAYHLLRHKDDSQVQMYKCDACNFVSKHKANFTRHHLTHKDPSEVQMYRCSKCDFESKYKQSLDRHARVHKNISQVQTYKCDTCSFEAKYEGSLEVHKLIHKTQ